MRSNIVSLIPIILLLSTFLIGIFSTDYINAEGQTLYVNNDGGTDYINIQDAINATNFGDTVYVYSGYYLENLIIDKNITLIGEDKINTTIDGNGKDVVRIFADNIELSKFTIKNGKNGININESTKNLITEITLTDNECGIYIDNKSSNNTIYNNNFINNIKNAYDLSENIWHNSSIGNYWSDYTGIDEDDNKIGDTPYNITGVGNQDIYPLIEPITKKPDCNFIYSPSYPTTQDTIQFNDTSIDLDGYITSWLWNLGDGNISSEQNTTHKYSDNGRYNITLRITDNYGSLNITYKQINILNVEPEADFIYYPENPNDLENVTFTDKSIDPDGRISNWLWTFGDGNNSNSMNPSYHYNDNGTYSVTLTVTDDDGATDIISKQITIMNVGPIASFSFSSKNITIIINDKLQFIDSSVDLDGDIISWTWDFGDETISNEENPIHYYSKNGVYNVKLTVIDNDGDSNSLTKPVTVSAPEEFKEIETGFSLFDIIFIIFIIIMVGMVIFLSKKFG
jgi:PKD repeat protein